MLALCKDPNVDLVVVAVRVGAHRDAVLAALEAGKDVFGEWPLAKGLKETVEMAEAAKKRGVRAMVGMQGRQSYAVRKVCSRFCGTLCRL